MEEKIVEFGTVEVACRPDTVAAPERLEQELYGLFYGLCGITETEEVILKWSRQGKPGKGEQVSTETVWRAKVSVGSPDDTQRPQTNFE